MSQHLGNALGDSSVASVVASEKNAQRQMRAGSIAQKLSLTAADRGAAAATYQLLSESDSLDFDQLHQLLAQTDGNDFASLAISAQRVQGGTAQGLAAQLAERYLDQSANSLLLMSAIASEAQLPGSENLAAANSNLGLTSEALSALIDGNPEALARAQGFDALKQALGATGLKPMGDGMSGGTASTSPLGAFGQAVGEAGAWVGVLNPAAGAVMTGISVALQAADQFPELKGRLEKLTSLISKDGLLDIAKARLASDLSKEIVQKTLGEAIETGYKITNKIEGTLVNMLEKSRNPGLRRLEGWSRRGWTMPRA